MCRANLEQLTELITKHLNKQMPLHEWKVLVNQHLPRQRGLTQRELAFAFRVIERKKLIIVMRQTYYYSFSLSQLSSNLHMTELPV